MMGLRVVAAPFKVHGNGEFDHKGAATSRFVQMLQHVAHPGVFGPWQWGIGSSKRADQGISGITPSPRPGKSGRTSAPLWPQALQTNRDSRSDGCNNARPQPPAEN